MSIQTQAIYEPSQTTETLYGCPVCSSDRSAVLHRDLKDCLFGSSGKWTLWECGECGVAFLNPRLKPEAIADAYTDYYTHGGSPPASTLRMGFRDFAIRAFAKRRLGSGSGAHLLWAEWIVRLRLPGVAEGLVGDYRYLPRPKPGDALLDIGCGNGDFVRRVQELGWRATGLEIDHKACNVARAQGLNVVQGAVPDTGLPGESFDVVTLHHVIEHVHDPQAVLRELLRLVKPNGRITLTTPNWRSFGADLFGPNWRGFEPPRHLVLFTPSALTKAVVDVGFVKPEIHIRTDVAHFYFLQSHAIASSVNRDSLRLPTELTAQLEKARAAAKRDPSRAEQFTLIATKPNGL